MDNALQILEIAAKIIGWLTVIVGGITAAVKYYRKMKTKLEDVLEAIRKQGEQIGTLIEHDNAQYMSLLRLTVMTDSIPLSERISAGREYIEKGGNGAVKEYVETHLLPHDKIVREDDLKQNRSEQ